MFEKVSLEEFERAYKEYFFPGQKPQIRTHPGDIDIYLEESEKLEELWNNIRLPRRSTPQSAGYDFHIPFTLNALPGQTYMIPTGIKANLSRICGGSYDTMGTNKPCFLALYPRSSLGFQYGFCMDNTVGIIDQDYYNNEGNEGHIMVGFTVQKDLKFNPEDRFFQAVIQSYYVMKNELDPVRAVRIGGLGSTGK